MAKTQFSNSLCPMALTTCCGAIIPQCVCVFSATVEIHLPVCLAGAERTAAPSQRAHTPGPSVDQGSCRSCYTAGLVPAACFFSASALSHLKLARVFRPTGYNECKEFTNLPGFVVYMTEKDLFVLRPVKVSGASGGF